MKTLILVRHGKAENGDSDKGRRLKKKGREETELTKDFLQPYRQGRELILASDARRTAETAAILRGPESLYEEDSGLYLATRGEIIQAISLQEDTIETIVLVGHNPGIQEAANMLVSGHVMIFTTAAAAVIECDIESWSDVLGASHSLLSFSAP